MIKKEGNKWVLYTKDGQRVLGVFSTKQEAMRREKQILYFKHKKGDKK
jgi:hypothetical protein